MPEFEAQNPNFARDLKQLVLNMPIVKFLGLRFLSVKPGDVQIEVPYREELTFVPGSLQAGPIGALVDIAAACSVTTLLPVGWANATVDFSVKILAPARGVSFVAHGAALSAGKTLSVAEAKVFAVENGCQTLCASGMATMRNFPVVAGD